MDASGKLPHRRDSALALLAQTDAIAAHRLEAFFSKAFAHELESRFRDVDEIIARLNQLDQPGSAGLLENPISVAAEIKAKLHRHSRPTILAEYNRKALKINTDVQALVQKLNGPLQEQEVSIGFQGKNPPKLPDGMEMVFGSMAVILQLLHHPFYRIVQIVIGAMGNECVVFIATNAGRQQQPSGPDQLEELLRYPGADDPPSQLILGALEAQIANALREIAKSVFGGQLPA
jgi:hypothetical protein